MLLQWLFSSIDDAHYLRLLLTRHDLMVIATQFCTCLIALGVIKQIEDREAQSLFKVSFRPSKPLHDNPGIILHVATLLDPGFV